MTAIIIFLAAWRRKGAAMPSLPAAIDVVLEQLRWMRLVDPQLTPQQAGAAIGADTITWAEVVVAYAAAWQALPETIRRNGNL